MRSKSYPIALLALIVFIGAVNLFAEIYYWYWRMRWFDMPMHFLGGVWLAATALWWYYGWLEAKNQHFYRVLAICIIASLGIGFLWEVFEAGLALQTVGHINAMPDTLSDLMFDTLGGVTTAFGAWIHLKNK